MEYGFEEFIEELYAPGIWDLNEPLWKKTLIYVASSLMTLELSKPARKAIKSLVSDEEISMYTVQDMIKERIKSRDELNENDLANIIQDITSEKSIEWINGTYLATHEHCNNAIRVLNLEKVKAHNKKPYASLLVYTSHVAEMLLKEKKYLCSLVE